MRLTESRRHDRRRSFWVPGFLLGGCQDAFAQFGFLQKLASLVLIAGLLGLGYVTTVRSVAAFQSAWRLTDTLRDGTQSPQPSRFNFENAEIPGPYQKGSELWDALREHLKWPRPTPPARNLRLTLR